MTRNSDNILYRLSKAIELWETQKNASNMFVVSLQFSTIYISDQ